MKNRIFIVFLLLSFTILSQKKFSKELSVTTDNDLYVSFKRDRYYTNGIFLSYSYLSKFSNTNLDKKIIEWQLSHEMYSPFKPVVPLKKDHDRPFASHLFGGFSVKNVFKDHKIFKFSLEIGVLGPAAFGEEIQDFIHSTFNLIEAQGWEYQIQNALSFSFNTSFIQRLFMNEARYFDINWDSTIQLGTVYTEVNSGINLRVGLLPLQEIMNSIAYKTQLNGDNTNHYSASESFFFIKPMFSYALYNATIQGSFLNKTSEVTQEIIPLIFKVELGVKFTLKNLNFGYSYNYNTNKSKELRYIDGNQFGKITFNYSWN